MVDGGLSLFWEVENLVCVALIYLPASFQNENFRLFLYQFNYGTF